MPRLEPTSDADVPAEEYVTAEELGHQYESCSIIARNVPLTLDSKEIDEYFSDIGELADKSYLFRDTKTKEFSGVVEVTFKSWSIARQVLQCRVLIMAPNVVPVEPAYDAGKERLERLSPDAANNADDVPPALLEKAFHDSSLARTLPAGDSMLDYFSGMSSAEFDFVSDISRSIDDLTYDPPMEFRNTTGPVLGTLNQNTLNLQSYLEKRQISSTLSSGKENRVGRTR